MKPQAVGAFSYLISVIVALPPGTSTVSPTIPPYGTTMCTGRVGQDWATARRLTVGASATVAARAAKRRRLIKTAIFNRHSPDESHLRRSVDLVNISSVAARCEVELCWRGEMLLAPSAGNREMLLLRVAGSKTHGAGVERLIEQLN